MDTLLIRLNRLLCLCGLAVFGVGEAAAQEFFTAGQTPRFNLLSRIDGLPSNAISSLFQDQRGFVWMGTQSGLVRYNGSSVFTYNNVPFQAESLPNDLVQTTYYDEQNDTIWVGTYAGLARLREDARSFDVFSNDPDDPASLSDDVVITITRGPDDHIWVGTQNGLNRMRDDGTFELIATSNSVIRDLFLDSQGGFWAGTLAGLERWNPATGAMELMSGLQSSNAMAIDELRPGVLLLGTWELGEVPGGIVAFETDSDGGRELWRQRFSTNSIYSVLVGSDGTLWAGSWGGGLFAVATDGTVYEFTPQSEPQLGDGVIYSLMEDQAGLVWVGTNGGGVHILSPRQRNYRAFFHDPDREGSLPDGRVTEIVRDDDDRLWVGTYGGGIAVRDEAAGRWTEFRSSSSGLANDIINRLFPDGPGRLWVASNGGLQLLATGEASFTTWIDIFPDAPLSGDIIYEIMRDSRGRYWVGTYRNGVTRYDPQSGELDVFRARAGETDQLAGDLIYGIREDSSGQIWVLTNSGLSRIDPDTDRVRSYRYDPLDRSGPSANSMRDMLEDSDGSLWFATLGGGINRFDPQSETFTHLTEDDGLPTNKILTLLRDESGRLWAGSQQGIVTYEPANGRVQSLDERDGLFGSEFNSGAWRERNGELLFGGAHGITRIDSDIDTRTTRPPSVQVVDVQLFQQSVAPDRLTFNGSEIELGPEDDFISFEFAAMDYEAVTRNTYRYRLIGFDDTWVDAGVRNFASYTNLPAGRYVLEVEAANAYGVWSDSPARLTLEVQQHWYLRWWALLLFGTLLVLIAYSAIRAREARALARTNRDLEHAVDQLAGANAELERLSIRDPLTGSFNRRYFDRTLVQEWGRARRGASPLSMLMVDIDHFKDFNDRNGHVTGDVVLREVASVMENCLSRNTDMLARYGGEEFAVILYETPATGAVQIAEQMRRTVEHTPLGHDGYRVTISIGTATMIPDGDDPTELLSAADGALYVAKGAGRNCVRSAAEPETDTISPAP